MSRNEHYEVIIQNGLLDAGDEAIIEFAEKNGIDSMKLLVAEENIKDEYCREYEEAIQSHYKLESTEDVYWFYEEGPDWEYVLEVARLIGGSPRDWAQEMFDREIPLHDEYMEKELASGFCRDDITAGELLFYCEHELDESKARDFTSNLSDYEWKSMAKKVGYYRGGWGDFEDDLCQLCRIIDRALVAGWMAAGGKSSKFRVPWDIHRRLRAILNDDPEDIISAIYGMGWDLCRERYADKEDDRHASPSR